MRGLIPLLLLAVGLDTPPAAVASPGLGGGVRPEPQNRPPDLKGYAGSYRTGPKVYSAYGKKTTRTVGDVDAVARAEAKRERKNDKRLRDGAVEMAAETVERLGSEEWLAMTAFDPEE